LANEIDADAVVLDAALALGRLGAWLGEVKDERTARERELIAVVQRVNEEACFVSRKKFREDLWFRLNVFPIVIPPLRLRRDDVPALIRHFVEVKRRELGLASAPAIAPGALVRLQEYTWPGNVRELENVVQRELIRNGEGLLRFEEIGATTTSRDQPGVERRGPIRLDEAMAAHIESVLATTGGKIHGPGGAAELLGVNENTLRNRMDRLRIVFRRRARASRRGGG
jgi:hydrogenase-4 transcriptional activator